jgi:hypothetical protein
MIPAATVRVVPPVIDPPQTIPYTPLVTRLADRRSVSSFTGLAERTSWRFWFAPMLGNCPIPCRAISRGGWMPEGVIEPCGCLHDVEVPGR